MLELYQSEGCSNSRIVRETLSALGVSYVVHNPRFPNSQGRDVTNELTYEELVAGGEDQIPYLVDTDGGVRMYDSDDIRRLLGNPFRVGPDV